MYTDINTDTQNLNTTHHYHSGWDRTCIQTQTQTHRHTDSKHYSSLPQLMR